MGEGAGGDVYPTSDSLPLNCLFRIGKMTLVSSHWILRKGRGQMAAAIYSRISPAATVRAAGAGGARSLESCLREAVAISRENCFCFLRPPVRAGGALFAERVKAGFLIYVYC